MDPLGFQVDRYRFKMRDVTGCLLKPYFLGDKRDLSSFCPDSPSSMSGEPRKTNLNIPRCLMPVVPDDMSYFLVSSPDGLHLLENSISHKSNPKSLLAWKRLATSKEPICKHLSNLLTTTTWLEKYGVSLPYSPAPSHIKSEMHFSGQEKSNTRDIGIQSASGEFHKLDIQDELKMTETSTESAVKDICCFTEKPQTTAVSTQTMADDSYILNGEHEITEAADDFCVSSTKLETTDFSTQITADDFYHLDGKFETKDVGSQISEEDLSPINHRSSENIATQTVSNESQSHCYHDNLFARPLLINVSIWNANQGSQQIAGGDTVYITNTPIGNSSGCAKPVFIEGTDAETIKAVIHRAMGQVNRNTEEILPSEIVIKSNTTAYIKDYSMVDDSFQQLGRIEPEGKSINRQGYSSITSASSFRCHETTDSYSNKSGFIADYSEVRISEKEPSPDVIILESESIYNEDFSTHTSRNSERNNHTGDTIYRSLVPVPPRNYRLLSSEVYKSPDSITISPFAAAGYKNQSSVPWSMVGCDVPFLNLDDVEPIFDEYHQQVTIGSGAYGSVVLGSIVNREDMVVAVKRFHRRQAISVTLDEVKLLLFLRDTGCVPHCYGVWRLPADPLNLSIVMEYFGNGETLRMWIDSKSDQMPHTTWIEICRQVFIGLKKIHDKHILINDIKSDNILLQISSNGLPVLKYIDFGLASFRSGIRYSSRNISKNVYQFLAPEVCEGGLTSVASDIYSAGYLLEEICYCVNLRSIKDVAYAITRTNPSERPSIMQVIIMIDKLLPTLDIDSVCSLNIHCLPTNGNLRRKNELRKSIWWSGRSNNIICQPKQHHNSIDDALPNIRTLANAGFCHEMKGFRQINTSPSTSPFGFCGYVDRPEIPISLSYISVPLLDKESISFVEGDGVSRVSLGKGSFGSVYLAYMNESEKNLAVKDFDLDQVSRTDIEIEAKLLIYLQDTGFVPEIFGFIHGDLGPDDLNIVQECVGNGCTLQLIFQSPPQHFTTKIWLEISAQLAYGMKTIHDKKVLINDVKSDNILIDFSATKEQIFVKYIDFGLSTFRNPYIFSNNDPEYLQKFTYLAPEVRLGHCTSPLSDIYSLGYILNNIAHRLNIEGLDEIANMCLKEGPADRPMVMTVYNLICGLIEENDFLS